VEYKDIWSGTQLDPNGTANGGAGLFRDPVYGPGTPENSLSGTIFTVDDIGSLDNISVPASMSQLRFWRNTSIASGNGGTLTNLLGYEWDSDLDNGFRPAGLIDMSSTTRNVNTLLLDNGATTGPGTATNSLTLYRDTTSGALVFGAGTVMWSWGLSNKYAPYKGLTAPVSAAVQQSLVKPVRRHGRPTRDAAGQPRARPGLQRPHLANRCDHFPDRRHERQPRSDGDYHRHCG
jgi:hypothetical protein